MVAAADSSDIGELLRAAGVVEEAEHCAYNQKAKMVTDAAVRSGMDSVSSPEAEQHEGAHAQLVADTTRRVQEAMATRAERGDTSTLISQLSEEQKRQQLDVLKAVHVGGHLISESELRSIGNADTVILNGFAVFKGPLLKPDGKQMAASMASVMVLQWVLEDLGRTVIRIDCDHSVRKHDTGRAKEQKDDGAAEQAMQEFAEKCAGAFPLMITTGRDANEVTINAQRGSAQELGVSMGLSGNRALKFSACVVCTQMHPQNMLPNKATSLEMAKCWDHMLQWIARVDGQPAPAFSFVAYVKYLSRGIPENTSFAYAAASLVRANELHMGAVIPFEENLPLIKEKCRAAGYYTDADVNTQVFATPLAIHRAQTVGASAAAVVCSLDGAIGGAARAAQFLDEEQVAALQVQQQELSKLPDTTAPSPLAPKDSGLTVAQHQQQIQQRLERSSTRWQAAKAAGEANRVLSAAEVGTLQAQ
eukprot:COSAG01_NODE_1625_length_9698_cov_4.854672_1_plen_475_part_10